MVHHRLHAVACGVGALVLAASAAACAPSGDEPVAKSGARVVAGRSIGSILVTNYTLAREADFASYSDFLCSGRGVAMQGTGIRNDGQYVKYVRGGGGWCGNYARLCNCGSAEFATTDRVFGASGRSLEKHRSIAVDPKRIPMGSSVWIASLHRWFRADDTGGAIVGGHVDVYTEDENPGYSFQSEAFVTSEERGPTDPGPNGEASEDEDAAEPRPEGGPFEALDVRYPLGEGHWITQCNESADGERVWTTRAHGRDASSRWAEAKYPQLPSASCGDATKGFYPIVLRSEAGGTLGTTWIATCAGHDRVANVYRVDGDVDGHPAAPFHHSEIDESCP